MKTHIFFLLLSFGMPVVCCAQIYVDPAVSAAVAAGSGAMNSQLKGTNERLTLIQKSQLALTGQLALANDLQSALYRGLSEVSGVMRSLLSVKDIYEVSEDILRDAALAVKLAENNPALLVFAESGAREFKSRAELLAAEVSGFVLKGGKGGLMDSGERAKLLGSISRQLSILRGVVYGLYRSMYWAKQRGFWNSLNPYSGFINVDRRIAEDILLNAKMLKP